MAKEPVLTIEDLSVCFGPKHAALRVVDRVSLSIEAGQTLALVGESGSGKTMTGKAVMGLLPRAARIEGGRITLTCDGRPIDMVGLGGERLRALRGLVLSMIFQEPMSALSPLHTIGNQVSEVLRVHDRGRGAALRGRVLETFEEVGFPDPDRAYRAYPFELSGGLRQRAMIAMAMVAQPRLVVADEPTTALDVTTQATVLDLLRRLQRDHGLAVLMISHDLGVVANMADTLVVIRRGQVMERGMAETVLRRPGHAYTRRLLDAAPKVPAELTAYQGPARDIILHLSRLSKTYPARPRMFGPPDPPVAALSDFTMELERGKTVAVVGESGSGKTTIAKLMLRAERPDPDARMIFRSADGGVYDIAALQGAELKAFRRRAQMVFQDPFAALSPRMSVQDILTEPLRIHGEGSPYTRRERAAQLMQRVGLSADHLSRFPYAFSGGQRQRIAIARALALEPELLVCDEPTSALDVSVQAEVLALLDELRAEMGLSYIFISHDLAVVSRLADRVMVMRRGRVIEEGSCDCIFRDARHPYTRALIEASPEPDPERRLDLATVAAGAGEPEEWEPPYGFSEGRAPGLVEVTPGHRVRAAA